MRIAVSNRSMPLKRTTWYPAWVIADSTELESAAVPPSRNTVLPGVSTRWISASVRESSDAGPVSRSGALFAAASGVPASASGKVSARASTTALAVPTPGKLDCEIAFAVSMRSAPEMRVIVLLDGLTTIGEAVMFVLGFEK